MALTYGFCLDGIDTEYSSAQFADAFHALVGDGIARYGSRFSVSVNGFTATLGSGFALAAGRWVRNDEPLPLAIQPSGNNDDRTDALVARVDSAAKKASIEILAGVNQDKLPEILRKDGEYSILLYLIQVRRGSTSLSIGDVKDFRADNSLCGSVVPLSDIAGSVLYIYQFLTSGIDQEVSRLIGLSEQVVQKANEEISRLDNAVKDAGGTAGIGELLVSRREPKPAGEWLLCDGGAVPPGYPALSAILGGTLPDISREGDRYRTYIYGGALPL